jgi:3-isopropylmalate/(R)-2-methylmalate dehydratase large subunit
LFIIRTIGTDGATGHVIEYAGETIRGLSMEERMTVCNMSIEAGARAGMIAPDDTTYSYLEGRSSRQRGRTLRAPSLTGRLSRAIPMHPSIEN